MWRSKASANREPKNPVLKRNIKDKNMKIDKIPDDAVLIKGTVDEYVDRNGNIYGIDRRSGHAPCPFLREQHTVWGYKYTKVRGKSRRVHRIVAETFIPNPENLPIVMHINNNKADNRVENLKWGTISENTKAAFADGLLRNAKGFDDSQSQPCDVYDTCTNKCIGKYGSRRLASEATGVTLGGIAFQLRTDSPIRKRVYFTEPGAGPRDHWIVVSRSMKDDSITGRYANCGDASRKTGVPMNTVSGQCLKGKPAWSASGMYFARMFLKGEEIIETDKEVE